MTETIKPDIIDPDGPEPIESVFRNLAEVQPQDPKWVIDYLIPVGLTFIVAPPKATKSTLLAELATLIADWKPHTDLPNDLTVVRRGGSVLLLSYEATAEELAHIVRKGLRCPDEAIKAGCNIHVADDPWAFRLDDANGLDRLLFWLKQARPSLLGLDPLRDMHDLDEKDSGNMTRILRPLRQWAVDDDSAVVIVHHTRKMGTAERGSLLTADDARGSSAFYAKADGIIILSPRDGARLHVRATFKRGASWEKTIQRTIWAPAPVKQPIGALDKLVLSTLRQSPGMTLDDVRQVLRVGKQAVIQSVKRLSSNGMIKLRGRKWESSGSGS